MFTELGGSSRLEENQSRFDNSKNKKLANHEEYEEFSVSSRGSDFSTELQSYKKLRSDFLAKYGDPDSPGYHRRRADEDIPKPEVTLGDDSNPEDIFQKSTTTTLECHSELLISMQSRLSLLEEKQTKIESTLEILVTEVRCTRQLLEQRLRIVPKYDVKE